MAEIEQAVAHAGARLVVTDAAARVPSPAVEALELDGVDRVPGGPVEVLAVHPGDPAVLFTTSGSTGTPKAFAIPHGAQGRAVASWITHYGLTPDDRVRDVVPPQLRCIAA